MSKITICIDPGHGGIQPGASRNSRLEKDDTLRLSLAIQNKLNAAGITTVLTRTTDKDVTINDRCKIANGSKANYFLSIHRNSSVAAKATGHEIWVYSKANASVKASAQVILDAVVAVSNQKNRGVKSGAPSYEDFGVNSGSTMPSALLELGFISNDLDNVDYDNHLNDYATAITNALKQILGIQDVAPFPYLLQMNVDSPVVTPTVCKRGTKYTITEEITINGKKYGKLKSGVGYVLLSDGTKK